MKRLVYLAGPIRPAFSEDVAWRKQATKELIAEGFTPLDPLRNHTPCKPGEKYGANELLHRDFQDIKRSDILLVYLPEIPEGTRPPTGVLIELGFAYALGGKLIAVVTTWGDMAKHQFIQGIATKIFISTNEALDFIVKYWR